MDKSIQYTQVMSNFDSVYNASPNIIHRPPIYMPISTSSSFSSHQNRSNPKFNLDLYNPNEYYSESIDYPSPSSSVIIHHHPVYSPPPSPSPAISKLRQINDELCHTLAQCDPIPQYQPQPSPSHHHIHHYPIPHAVSRSRSRSRSRSPSEEDSSSTESEPIIKKRNARITYKARIPRRPNSLSQVDQLLLSTSDVYSHDDPMTIDLYPTRDQGFVKKIRNRPDNQSPWLADTSPIRRNSYSETSSYRTPRAPYYDDTPITPKSRLANGKDFSRQRPRSSSVKSRLYPDRTPNPLRRSAVSFSNTAPVWRPNGTIKHPKFIGSNAPPSKPKPKPQEPTWNPAGTTNKAKQFRAFDPVSKSLPTKSPEPVWKPSSKTIGKKPLKYFEPTMKPELIVPFQKETVPVLSKKPTRIFNTDPKLKTRIAKAESKVKSAWEPTTTDQESKPPVVPRPMKKPTNPPKPKVKSLPSRSIVPVKKTVPAPPITTDTGRSSLKDVPTKPLFESTPRNQSINEDPDDLFENESKISEPSKKPEIPHPPPQIEITPTKLPKTTVPEPDQGTKSTIKDGVLIHGDDADNRIPSPTSEVNNNDDNEEEASLNPSPTPPKRQAPSPKPDNRDDASVVDDEDINQPNANETDEDVVLNDEAKDADDTVSPSTPKADIKTPPPRKEPSPLLESPDQSLSQTPVTTKKNDRQLPSTPPPPPAATTDKEADDFFD